MVLHSDLSVRNLLVSGGAVDDEPDEPPRVTAVLDWEFSVAGLAEEEITFPATLESHATDADEALIRSIFAEAGVVAPAEGARTRKDHVSAYWQLIVACHSGAWKEGRPVVRPSRAGGEAAVDGGWMPRLQWRACILQRHHDC